MLVVQLGLTMAKEAPAMRVRMLAKDPGSGRNGCPAVYAPLELPDSLVIQAPQADGDTMGNLANLLDGETAVIIKREVVENALRKLCEQDGVTS